MGEGIDPSRCNNETRPRNEVRAECLDACAACASVAENCAALCSRSPEPKQLARIVALARTCADVCLLTARLLAQQSEFVQEYCALCAEVCHTLRQECLRQASLSYCQCCAEVALRCDKACRRAAV